MESGEEGKLYRMGEVMVAMEGEGGGVTEVEKVVPLSHSERDMKELSGILEEPGVKSGLQDNQWLLKH